MGAGIVFGLALSVASTVVLLKTLEDNHSINSGDGRVAVGWVIVEDLVMILVLVLLPALAEPLGGNPPAGMAETSLLLAVAVTLGKVAVFAILMLVVGTRLIPWLLVRVERTGSRELFTLGVLAIALGVAFGSAVLFDISFALGAFFAGVIVNSTDLSHQAAEKALPLQDAFACCSLSRSVFSSTQLSSSRNRCGSWLRSPLSLSENR